MHYNNYASYSLEEGILSNTAKKLYKKFSKMNERTFLKYVESLHINPKKIKVKEIENILSIKGINMLKEKGIDQIELQLQINKCTKHFMEKIKYFTMSDITHITSFKYHVLQIFNPIKSFFGSEESYNSFIILTLPILLGLVIYIAVPLAMPVTFPSQLLSKYFFLQSVTCVLDVSVLQFVKHGSGNKLSERFKNTFKSLAQNGIEDSETIFKLLTLQGISIFFLLMTVLLNFDVIGSIIVPIGLILSIATIFINRGRFYAKHWDKYVEAFKMLFLDKNSKKTVDTISAEVVDNNKFDNEPDDDQRSDDYKSKKIDVSII